MLKITVEKSLKNFSYAVLLYFTAVIILITLSSTELLDDQFALICLHLCSALSFYIYWRHEPWGPSKYDSFGSVFLLLSIGFRCFSALDTLIYGTRFVMFPKTISVDSSILSLVIRAEIITQIGALLMVMAWRLTVGRSLWRFTFIDFVGSNNMNYFKVLYILNLLTQFSFRIIGIDYQAFFQLIIILNFTGVASIYFLALSNIDSKRFSKLIKAFILALPLSFFALNTGMKESIFFPFIPVIVILWITYSHAFVRASIIMLSISVFAASQFYVNYTRENAWRNNQVISPFELIKGTLGNTDNYSMLIALNMIGYRVNPTGTHAITLAIADRDGFIPAEIFSGIPANFIPRILWSDKPILVPGQDHTQRILGNTADLSQVGFSSTAPGFFLELYLGGGILGLTFFSLFYGFLVGRIQLSILTRLPSSATDVFNFIMFYSAFRLDENTISYALSGIVLFYILMLFIFNIISIILVGIQRNKLTTVSLAS